MKKLLVIEDKYGEVENSFKMMNTRYYKETLEIHVKSTYQSIGGVEALNDFDMIALDIDLGRRSEKDGFGLLDDIKQYDGSLFLKVLILTGSDFIRKKLNLLGYENIPLLLKPIDYKTLYSEIKKIIPS